MVNENTRKGSQGEQGMDGIPTQVMEAAKEAEKMVTGQVKPETQAQPQPASEPTPTPQLEPTPQPQPTPQPAPQPKAGDPENQEPHFRFQDYLDGVDEVKDNPTELYDRLQHLGTSHKVLHGKYRKEVPRLQEENATLRQQVELLTKQLEAAKTQPPAPQPGQPPAQTSFGENTEIAPAKIDLKALGYTDAQIEAWGEDDLRQMVVANQKAMLSQVKPLQDELNQTREQLRANEVHGFEQQVKALVPNFDVINNDPDFVGFLDQPITPYASFTRRDAVNEALRNADAKQLAAIMHEFAPQPSGSARDSQIVPSPASGPTPPAQPQNGKIYTVEEYSRLQDNILKGAVSGEQAAALQKELDLAVAQHRIRR
jgi:hypothetical protein